MSTYTKPELEALWVAANPGKGDPHLMAAIAMAESSGNSGSVNSIGACGLWQIHPYETGCLSPLTNAQQAGRKLTEQGLGAWETFTNGSYRQFLTGSPFSPTTAGAGHLQQAGLFEPPINPFDPFPQFAPPIVEGFKGILDTKHFLAKLAELFLEPGGWIRIGKLFIGGFILMVGLLGMANLQPPSASGAVGAATTAKQTAGKAAKLVATEPVK